MIVTFKKTEIDAEEPKMDFGYREALTDPRWSKDDGNGGIEMDADKLHQIRAAKRPQPGMKPRNQFQMQTALMAATAPPTLKSVMRMRTPEEKALLRPICAACSASDGTNCTAFKCCGGKLPLEVVYNLTTTDCPLGKFPKLK